MADNYYLDVSYINRFVSSFNIQTSNSLACAKQSSSEAAEENPADYFLSPVETMGAYFGRVDENQSNPSVQWSNELNIAWSNQRLAQKKRPRTLSFGVEGSTFREKGNEAAECLFLKNQSPPFSECPLKFPVERIENEGTSLTDYIDWNILHATSSKHVISSIEKTTDNVSPGSSAGADLIHIAGPSEIQTQSQQKGKKKPLNCGVCQKTFNHKGHLNRHKRTHEKPFECNICGKRFSKQGRQMGHLRTHKGEKPFECNICGNRYTQQGSLTLHLRIHNGETPFECNNCSKRFADKSNLTRHLRIHTGEKLSKCDICGKRFAKKQNLVRHLHTHTGE